MGSSNPEPIAIIGSGCRLPGGSSSPSKLWELLRNPRDLLKKVDRFNADSFYNKDGHHHGATNVRHSYLLDEDFRLFDPGFFGIKPVEAESIDPLQRLVLETVYESLENAGLAMGDLQGSDTAFYAGIMAADYQDLLLRDIENLPTYFGTGTSRSIIANRVSYVFDWHGPSMTIDTACSSSMLALHQAVQTLRNGTSDVAVAAGGNLILGPEIYIAESKLNMLSSKGRSAMWDANVDGYGRGEGFVSVVLKRLSDAIRDGDSIDCIIRQTGTNQDGRTKGITMPSATAQTLLIRDTYAHAGLDLQNARDRPQFFEAHGTGTKAGDPVEAEAIYNAFFGSDFTSAKHDQPIYVGSIKTVVGHTEGTAGLAGILKASLALQAGIVPPNMLFNSLNPGLTPFYGPLQVPTEAKQWPPLPPGVPRRASVNSFGFGGSNAHAILESYTPVESTTNGYSHSKRPSIIPYLFSAASETALQSSLSAHSNHLKTQPGIDMSDLAWTLRARRSTLPVKLAIPASSVGELVDRIDQKLQSIEGDPGSVIGVRSVTGRPRILGVFTGQGAQWARMGQILVGELPFARDLVTKLDAALQSLPQTYRPTWSLADELRRDSESSRVQEAVISQPMCTLVQVTLVELVRTAGITFSAVVGHSSGEIGAAYAAGFLSATDAVKIAYLRGFHASLAAGPSGQKGSMLAVGTSIEDAEELCGLPDFKGRLKLAASNSSSSVTLSGDATAIAHAKIVFDDEKKFARLLKIDTAYHSHHMQPCAEPYVQSMKEVGIQVLSPDDNCAWYSSVHGGTRMQPGDSLGAEYWKDNMVNPVLFSQALTSAVKNGGPFNLALEIGPHPALKGPASQTIQELGVSIPYSGTLKRGQSDLEAISDCFATVWASLGNSAINFDAVQTLLSHQQPPKLLKGLPTYGWDHDKPYWFESRKSKLFRSRERPSHELLGVRCDEGSDNELRWRNFLSIQEVPWLDGHQVQSQTVFPAAGYVSMAVEAAKEMVGERSIQLLEVQDLNIGKAIVLQDEKSTVETMTSLSSVSMVTADHESKEHDVFTADFTVLSHLSRDHINLTKVASGKVKVIVGPGQALQLPSASPKPCHLIDVDTDRFYSALESCGYGYSGPFRALSNLQRRLNFCTGSVERPASPSTESALLVHPALLDPAFQAVLGGYFWPGDGRLWSLFLPTSIRKVTISPSICQQDDVTREVQLPFDAWLVDSPVHEIQGDVAIYNQGKTDCSIQIEGLRMVSFVQADPSADRPFFSETVWGVSAPDGDLVVGSERASDEEWELATACERVAYFYWRELEKALTPHERENCEPHHKQLLKTMARSFEQVSNQKHPHVRKEWQQDDEKSITDLVQKFSSSIDIRLQSSVGKALPGVVRGETTMLEHMLPDNMLDDFYTHGLGFTKYNKYLAKMVRQLAHRYPRMNFIEIGAGTGGATSAVLEALDSAYSSYTYTDISSGFFEKAAARFASEGDKLIFKMLDAEKQPASQGYQPNTYDVVIASNVLHATANLQNTLKNVRSLLKPGGYLFLLEITNNEPIRLGFTMGGLPGWWLGANDDRPYSPCISASNWNRVLRKSGFSGVDTTTPSRDQLPHPFSILASQAVDDRVEQLRRPLIRSASHHDDWSTLCVLGGQELETSNLVEEVTGLVGHRFDEVITIESIDAGDIDIPSNATVISFLDLDCHVLQNMPPLRLKALQAIFSNTRSLLWVTQGAQNDNPYANATLGLLRSVAAETPTLQCQLLDFDTGEKPHLHPQVCVEALLRLRLTGSSSWERDNASKNQVLWSTEPELCFRGGKLWAPRILLEKKKNDRLNGQRREIRYDTHAESSMDVSRQEGSWSLRERYGPLRLPSDAPEDSVLFKARFSTLAAPKLQKGALILAIGMLAGTDQWAVVATMDRSSTIRVNSAQVVLLQEAPDDPAHLLDVVLAGILSDQIASLASENQLVLVLEPNVLLASILLQRSRAGSFQVKFVTQDYTKSGTGWIHLSPWQSERAVKEALPRNVSSFVDLASPTEQSISSLVATALPPGCNTTHLSSMVQNCPSKPGQTHGDDWGAVQEELKAIVARATSRSSPMNDSTEGRLISLAKIPQLRGSESLALIDWRADVSVSLQVAQIRPNVLFKCDKTYLLVGLTGEIGRSLCRWMVQCGAGAVVLTSRNPRIDQAWIDELESGGSKIRVVPMDASSRESIVELHAMIKRDLPPVAGIANGAMVLRDQFFADMDLEALNTVLGPKVDASLHLDEVFSDTPLDFFIMFSSLASIVGNRGQSNYAAANTFMASLARQRRTRGQPGSVMSIGRMVGLGYLERVSDVVELQLIKYGFMPISEVDLHHLFAQTIMAGLPDSGEDPDIITALRPTREDDELQVPWYYNPRFSHMILPAEKEDVVMDGKKVGLSTRAQLEATTSTEEARKVLEDCFSHKLQVILQMAASSFRADAALIELGVDSLVAVEIRSWFLKEVGVDMAVLKILGGASTVDLCQHGIDQASKDLLPNLGNESQKEEKEPAKAVKKDPAHEIKKEMTNGNATQTASTSTTDSPFQSTASTAPITRNAETPVSSVESDDEKTPMLGSHSQERHDEKAPQEKREAHADVVSQVKISSAQSRFWFLNIYMEDQTTSNVTFFYEIRGRIQVSNLSRALQVVGNAHEGLRTCFFADERSTEGRPADDRSVGEGPVGTAWQGVMKTSKLELEHRKISKKSEITSEYARVRDTVYDLAQGKTMRIVLLSLDSESHAIIFGYHHIVMDGVGFQIFLRDLESAYAGKALATPAMQYPSFSEKQRRAIDGGSLAKDLAFWRQELRDAQLLPLLPVAKVSSRQAMNKYSSCHVQHRLPTSLADRIRATCRGLAVTPSHFYLATFRVFLSRLACASSICIGMADANRRDVESMSTVGLFLNLLPLLFKATGSETFHAVVQETRNKVYEALGHSDAPLDEILNTLGLRRSASHSPLFQAFFDYRQGAKESLDFVDLKLQVGEADLGEMAYDIILDVTEGSQGSLVVLRGQDYLYGPGELKQLLDCYLSLLEAFVGNPQTRTDEAELFAAAQVQDALEAGRGPKLDYEWPSTVGHRIHDIIQQNADLLALKDGQGAALTYRDLERRVHTIREELVAKDVKPGDKVAIFQKPTAEWICCILAILWAGAVYVPLDSRNPLLRLASIIQAARPSAILADASTVEVAPKLQAEYCKIIDTSRLTTGDHHHPRAWSIPASAEDPAIVLFTSGSTGTPKGLVLRHRSLVSHLESYIRAYDVGPQVVLQQSAFSFDLSLAQIFTALTTGGKLVVIPEDKRGDSAEIVNMLCEEGVTWTFATPSEYTSWLEIGEQQLRANFSWSSALSGGERLTPGLVRLFRRLGHEKLRLYNTYGPAETIISATMGEVDYRGSSWNDDRPVPVGSPLPNYSIYVLDDRLNALPRGFHGEVFIGGPAPVIGYLNNAELTRDHFLVDRFASAESKTKGWTIMYRTGDMGRLTSDGRLLFEGRRGGDTQVKLRGIRVDLTDIQSTMINASGGMLSDAAVSVRTKEQVVIAHVVFAHGRKPEDAASYLKGLVAGLPLPPYMRPAMVIPIEAIPLNIHGKKDLMAIAQLALPQPLPQQRDPSDLTTVQRRLAQLWREILPKEFAEMVSIGEDTDFFEAGGNSLLLVKLQGRLRDTFQAALALKDMFDCSTLGAMATRIEQSQALKTIDWDAETALEACIVSAAGSLAQRAASGKQGRSVLLTGATGYLGSYILRQLLENPSIYQVHCLAVREISASDKLPLSNRKVVVHQGDLTSSRLGLSEPDARHLSENVSVILHCGARRSFWDNYHQLKAVNFDPTKELVRLAAPRRIPIHFLSSSGVMHLAGTSISASIPSAASFKPRADGSEGYVASKWASEVYLENAAAQLAIPVTIHRFTPAASADDADLGHQSLQDLLHCAHELNSLPDPASWEGQFDLIQSEGLAKRIAAAVAADVIAGSQARTAMTEFVHHQSEVSFRATDVFEFLERASGTQIHRRVPALEWIGEIKKIGFGYLFASHDVSLESKGPNGTRLVNRR